MSFDIDRSAEARPGWLGRRWSTLLFGPSTSSSSHGSAVPGKTEHHVREPLAVYQDVAVKSACSELLVTGADGFENSGVFLQRLQQAVSRIHALTRVELCWWMLNATFV
jgi:hypothetical protein